MPQLVIMVYLLRRVTLIASCMVTLTFLLLFAYPAKANFTPLPPLPAPIYIRSDGSIDPPTSCIEKTANTYILTGNINTTIEVQRDNVTIVGNGFEIMKPEIDTTDLMIPIGWMPGIHLGKRTNITLEGITFLNGITGTKIENSSNITIVNCSMTANSYGIVVNSCSYLTITDNQMVQCSEGLCCLDSVNHLDLTRNSINACGDAINIASTIGNLTFSTIVGNDISANGLGMLLRGSDNYIIGNNFQFNSRGILFYSSDRNIIGHNNFIGDGQQATYCTIAPMANIWDNGREGNYWSNYNGTDLNGDGIGDSPYIIDQPKLYAGVMGGSDAQDRFPLMKPVNTTADVSTFFPITSSAPTPVHSQTPTPTLKSSPTPTSSPSSTLSPSPSIPEFPTWLILPIVLASTLIMAYKKNC